MKSLRHMTPAVRVYAGADALDALAGELDRAGIARAVVFCGGSVARHPNGLARVQAAIGERCAGVFDAVKAHSPVVSVEAGAALLERCRADGVIAVGGGSAVVSARAASILLAEGRRVTELCTQFPAGKSPVSPRLDAPKLPQLVVATTPTTAYAKAGSAVRDDDQGRRLALFDPKTRAGALFFHPDLAATAPFELTLGAAVSALSLAIQGIESRSRDPLADALLLHAVRLFAQHLRALIRAPDDPETRLGLMFAALLAGQGTDFAPSGLASALGHAIGARHHLDNGIVNAVLLPHTMRFNAPATEGRLALVAEGLGAPAAGASVEAVVSEISRLFADLGLPSRLRDLQLSEAALDLAADDAAADWFLRQNPRKVAGTAELRELLRAAW